MGYSREGNRLGDSLTLSNTLTFQISHENVRGPMNLHETILSAQTSEPEWERKDSTFIDIEELDGTLVKYSLNQNGGADEFKITVNAMCLSKTELPADRLRSHLSRVLGFSDDLESFYKRYSDEDEPLSSTFSRLRGLRLMRGTNLYESLICSMLSQNNSALLWNRTARLLMKYYGRRVNFPQEPTHYLFPEPHVLSRVLPRELRSKTSMGYRAKPVVQVSKLVSKGVLRLEEVVKLPYSDAMEELLELPGVGPKVADCFLLYGAGRLAAAPVDVWIHRIVTRLYFRGRKVSRMKIARFLRERFTDWAGYAQLYLFDFARREAKTGKAGK
jgi:N-glycosylase/DNA lyase